MERDRDWVTAWRCLLVTAILAAWLFFRKTKTQRCGVPGPLSVPLLGSLALLGRSVFDTMAGLRAKYGDIYLVKIGSVDVVVLNGLRTVQKALVDQRDAFAGRPPLFSFRLASEGKSMVFNSYNKRWKLHRKLAEEALKMADKGTGFLDNTIEEEFSALMAKFAEYNERGVDPEADIMWAVARAKYRLCYGGAGQTNFPKMVESTLRLIGCHNRGSVLNFFPWLRTLLLPVRRQIESLCAEILALTRMEEAHHLSTLPGGSD